MTETARRSPLLISAAALGLACGLSCHRAPVPAVPPVALASVLAPAPPPSTTTAAMTMKPADLNDAVRAQSRQPQPPAAPCLEVPAGQEADLPDLLEQAGRNFEKGRYEESLECAREATRIDGASVAAHHFRGAALAELGRLDEARTAYARALALDPGDPEVLRSVADLHVRRLGGRDDLELALQYIHTALPRAAKAKDRTLQKELSLLQAMALDDLGRPADALSSATRASELDPKDREARREKGVALFELCRFDLARQELLKLTSEEPDAWAEHYLGLIAERGQDGAAAAAHFARARQLDPDAFKPTADAPGAVFDRVVEDVKHTLPPAILGDLGRSQFAIEDLPEVSDLVATDPPLSPGILGLFRPPAEGAPEGARPAIILYRKNLARAAHSEEELRREVRDTLMHEVGHLNGEDDEQLRDRGL